MTSKGRADEHVSDGRGDKEKLWLAVDAEHNEREIMADSPGRAAQEFGKLHQDSLDVQFEFKHVTKEGIHIWYFHVLHRDTGDPVDSYTVTEINNPGWWCWSQWHTGGKWRPASGHDGEWVLANFRKDDGRQIIRVFGTVYDRDIKRDALIAAAKLAGPDNG